MVRQAPAHIPKNGKSYHIHTFGCQMNLADSERMAGVLDSVSGRPAGHGWPRLRQRLAANAGRLAAAPSAAAQAYDAAPRTQVGYECSEDPDRADVLIYNTCSIREKAEMKVYSALGRQVRARPATHAVPGRALRQGGRQRRGAGAPGAGAVRELVLQKPGLAPEPPHPTPPPTRHPAPLLRRPSASAPT
jgi:tRNA-2-methylthio-N6-dimethylallyladenosine synthase